MAIEHNTETQHPTHRSHEHEAASQQNTPHHSANNDTENSRRSDTSKGDTEHQSSTGTSGRGWHGDPEGHAAAGRKGGQKVARDREHMAAIGRKGGEAVSRDRQHMAEIGRKGGQSRGDASAERTNTGV